MEPQLVHKCDYSLGDALMTREAPDLTVAATLCVAFSAAVLARTALLTGAISLVAFIPTVQGICFAPTKQSSGSTL